MSSDQNSPRQEDLGDEIKGHFGSGDGGSMLRTLKAYAFNYKQLADAVLEQEWGGYTKPLKFFISTFGLAAASVALFGTPPDEEESGKFAGILGQLKPYIWLLAQLLPYAYLLNKFLGTHGRSYSDTARILCYANGTVFAFVALMAPFMESRSQWLPVILGVPAILLLIVRPFQIFRYTHGVGLGRYLVAVVGANIVSAIPTVIVLASIAWLLGALGIVPASQ